MHMNTFAWFLLQALPERMDSQWSPSTAPGSFCVCLNGSLVEVRQAQPTRNDIIRISVACISPGFGSRGPLSFFRWSLGLQKLAEENKLKLLPLNESLPCFVPRQSRREASILRQLTSNSV